MDDNLLLQAATSAWKALRFLGERGKRLAAPLRREAEQRIIG